MGVFADPTGEGLYVCTVHLILWVAEYSNTYIKNRVGIGKRAVFPWNNTEIT